MNILTIIFLHLVWLATMVEITGYGIISILLYRVRRRKLLISFLPLAVIIFTATVSKSAVKIFLWENPILTVYFVLAWHFPTKELL
jgi:hypothetical protein